MAGGGAGHRGAGRPGLPGIAQYSLTGLTALSLVFPIQQLATALATGAGTGLGILIARMDGSGDTAAQRDAIKSGLWLGVFDFALFACVTLAALQGYFALSSDQPLVRQQGVQYARVVLAGSLGLFVESHCTKILQARGNTFVSEKSKMLNNSPERCRCKAHERRTPLWNASECNAADAPFW